MKVKEKYAGLLKEARGTLPKLAESVGSDDRQTLALRQQYAMEHQHRLKKELLEVQSQARKLEAQLKRRRPDATRKAEEDGESRALRHELEMLAELEGRLGDEIKSISSVNKSATAKALDIERCQREISRLQALAEMIDRELASLDAALAAPSPVRSGDDRLVTRTPILVVDAQGRPVEGVAVGTHFQRDADSQPRFISSAKHTVISEARGELTLDLDFPAHWDGLGIYAIGLSGDPPLVGLRKVTREEALSGKPIAIVMHPACRVRLRIECPGFRAVEEKYHVEPRGERWRRMAEVPLGDDLRAPRPVWTRSTTSELELLLPPGRFLVWAGGQETESRKVPVVIEPGHRVLSLGVVDLPPSPSVREGFFYDHHYLSPADRDGDEAADSLRLRPRPMGPRTARLSR